MNRRTAIQALLGAGAGSVFSAFGDSNDDDNLTFQSETKLVLLEVSVKNRDGGFTSGLARENFRVFENGRRQEITVFDHSDSPVTIGLLVDESRSMAPKRAGVLTAALTFIGESNPTDEVFVLNFNDSVKAGLPQHMLFSDDRTELRSALFRGVSEGRTALYDAVAEGLKQLELGRRDKKTLVLISDGGDNCSNHTRREAIEGILGSVATIYTIGLFDNTDPDRDPGILKDLARISGGEAFFPSEPGEMINICRRIAHDIRNCYTIGYLPPEGKNPHEIRNIHVEVSSPDHPNLRTRTRTSYRYDRIAQTQQK